MWNKIIDPNTNLVFNINTNKGKSILKKFIKQLYGGTGIEKNQKSSKQIKEAQSSTKSSMKKQKPVVNISLIDDDIEKYIKPLNRDNSQYGWYVYIDRKKADFGGVHITKEDSKKMAIDFIKKLKEEQKATYLDAGNSLEPTTTTS